MQVPSHVEYERATSVDHALSLLSRPDTRVLAGGHSLIPMMKLRLAQPEMLVDINGLTELSYIKLDGAQLRIGALARHADLLDSAEAGRCFPIFHDAERVVADPIVRLWGTVGGSLCQADPSEDLSAAFAAAHATAVIRGQDGDREVPVREFHLGPYETVVGRGELLAEVRVPVPPGTGSAYEKVARRVGDWSVAAAGAVLRLDAGVISEAGIGLTAVGAEHFVAAEAEEYLRGRAPRRGELRPGRSDRRGALPPRRRPARARGLQAAPGRRAHHPRPAPCRRARDATPPRDGRSRMTMRVAMTVNGTEYARDVEPRLLLIHFIRDELGLTGSHWGCDTSNCGSCVVWLDDQAGQGMHGSRGDGGRPHRPYCRGPGAGRPARPGAAGFRRVSRPAVRVLHAGHDDDRALAARPQPGPGRGARSARPSPARSAGAPATRTSSGRSAGPPSTRPSTGGTTP